MALRNRLLLISLIVLLSAGGSGAWAQNTAQENATGPAAGIDQRALDMLKKMSDTISGSKTVSFHAVSMVPIRTQAGIWVNLFNDSHVTMQQPDKLFAETRGDFAPYDFYYDGKTITAFAPNKNLYAEKAAPATIDALIENAYKEEGRSFPYADILVSEPYSVLTEGLEKAYYVGQSAIGKVKTNHLVFFNKNVQWQIWIGAEDNLPRLVNATYLSETGEPSYTVEFLEWKLNEEIQPAVFTYKNTTEASKIEFRRPAQPGAEGLTGAAAKKQEDR